MRIESENEYETVVIEGELWAVTSPDNDPSSAQPQDSTGDVSNDNTAESRADAEDEPDQESDAEQSDDESVEFESGTAGVTNINQEIEEALEEFDALRSLTRLLVGGAIEGTSQLTARLQRYEEALRQEAAEMAAEGYEREPIEEDELVRLRYALVGLVFDAQETFWRNVSLWARAADRSVRVSGRVAQPVTNSFVFNPLRRRYENLIKRGEDRLARWTTHGRVEEQPSRELARRTYNEVIDEFIDRLADNPQLQAVITKQSIGVASDMRDEVRERTVTADNLVEGLVRRILRRTPRGELPEPPPEVQRWAGLSLEEYRAEKIANERKDDSS